MSEISCRTVTVISKGFDNNRDAAGAVSLINYFLVIVCVAVSCRFFDYSVDIIIRNVIDLCLRDDLSELAVSREVRSALLDCRCNLSAYLCEYFGPLSIRFFFFMLNL